jgi:hypothetical protein
MSSQHSLGLPAASAATASSVPNINGSASFPTADESPRVLHNATIDSKRTVAASSDGNWPKSNIANDPLASHLAASTSDAQSDAASASSSGSQTDGGTTKRRTRNHYTRSKTGETPQNGGEQPDQQVSTLQ